MVSGAWTGGIARQEMHEKRGDAVGFAGFAAVGPVCKILCQFILRMPVNQQTPPPLCYNPPTMDQLTLQNYRCFGPKTQTARLAPLTLLVGPNGTGKTSLLALLRALWDVAFREIAPNFREPPYDLGAFPDIVHRHSDRVPDREAGWDTAEVCFTAGFRFTPTAVEYDGQIAFEADFVNRHTAPYPIMRRIVGPGVDIEFPAQEIANTAIDPAYWPAAGDLGYWGLHALRDNADRDDLSKLHTAMVGQRVFVGRPFAGAPLQSRPQRTYDPIRPAPDPEGGHIPSYLANLSRRDPDGWQYLKADLESFGRAAGLFDEISVRPFGKTDGDPFQLQIRKHGKRRKGPWRNLIDAGYGVSQALPLITQLLRRDAPDIFLLQQPEIHLHPQAEAALGSLLATAAANGRQIIAETHSDYLIDRVRMDVRDGVTALQPDDVSILYFEPGDSAVKIHSIRLDEMGNTLDAPPSYGKFFMDEINRSVGLVKPDVRHS